MRRILPMLHLMWTRRDFRVLIVCNLLLGLSYSFVIPFTSLFGTQEVGLSPNAFAAYMLLTSISGVIIATWLARWSDLRISRKTLLLVSGLFGAAGYLGNAYLRDFTSLTLVGMFLLGVSSVSFSQLFAYARDCIDKADLPAADTPLLMNVFRLFFAFSWTVGPAISSWVLAHGTFRHIYLIAAAFFLIYSAIVAAYIPKDPPSALTQSTAQSMPWHRTLRVPGLAAYFLAFVCFNCSSTLGMMSLPLLIVNTLNGTETQVGIAYSLAPIFEVPLMFFVGILATRMETVRLIRATMLVAVAYFAGLFLVNSPVQVYPLQFLSAAMVAVNGGVAITFFQDILRNQPGTATNLYSNAHRIGSMIGYLLFGALQSIWPLRSVFAVSSGLCLLAFIFMYWKRQTKTHPVPRS